MSRTCLLFVLGLLTVVPSATAQLNSTFDSIFDIFLRDELQLSPGPHAEHYVPAAILADSLITPALNSLVASNVASFPLSSTVAGVTFDFSTGQPVRVTESLGPIFAENAETVGQGRIALGLSATQLGLTSLRGVPVKDLRFTFTHQDVGDPGLGDNPNESDLLDVYMDLNVDASIVALSANYGIGSRLDVGIAVPIVSVTLSGTARAVITSFTLFDVDAFGGGARHYFGGDNQNPDLTHEVLYDERATGIGDVAVRLKYRFPLTSSTSGLAALADVRLPTGNAEDFHGTGALNYRLILIGSSRFGAFNPHVNLGYNYRGADFDSDEMEFALGFDQQISGSVTFAFDVMGDIDLNSDEAIQLFPGTATIRDHSENTGATALRTIPLSNIPEQDYDHVVNASMGFRFAPSDRFQVLANLIVPLQDGGLRSGVVPTIGASYIP